MKLVARYYSRHEADLAAGFLRDAGVPALVRSDDASGWEPGLTFGRSAWIAVPEADATRALEVLHGLDAAGQDAAQEPAEAKGTPRVGLLIVVFLLIPPLVIVGQLAVWAASRLGVGEPPAAVPDVRAALVAAALAAVIVVAWRRRFWRHGPG